MNGAADIARQAAQAISNHSSWGLDPKKAQVLITTPKGWKPPPRFPKRDIIQVKDDGTRVSYVSAMNVLAWLAAHGFVKVEFQQ